MSVCSEHQIPVNGCRACKVNLSDHPGYEEMNARALAAGEQTCVKCKFVYYKTIEFCPLCYHER